jgi:myo-inositol 2-dehydrogenase/D-chiro-inositol 1-dehydrogenase
LVAVADTNPATARAVAADLGEPRWYGTADELAADPEVDAVVIASIASAPPRRDRSSGEARRAILCEKPIAVTIADADAAIAAVANAGVSSTSVSCAATTGGSPKPRPGSMPARSAPRS